MAQNYTRQSSFADGDTITAALFNNEFNQVVNAFAYSASSDSSTGHKHDGTSGQGGNIPQIGDIDFLNKIVVDNTNNRWGFYVQVSGGTVEQLRIQDGAIVPVTNNDIDLGTSSLEFKDLFLDGTAHIDTLDVDVNATVAGTLGVTGASTLTGNVTATNDLSVGGNLTVTGNATIAGNLTFGDAATDTVAFSADVASNLLPSVDNTYDLGAAGSEWKDLYIDGTANIDSLVADTADINGGTIDGATIATSDITVGSGKTLNVSAGTLTLADDQISGDKVEGGTIAATTITTLTSTTVDTTNLEVTTLKAKDGTAAGSIADSTGVVTLASSVLTTTDINGGTIDSAVIGGTTPAAITGTAITATGIMTATGTSVFASLDISGDIDVDGTTNLDVVDIDGAVQADGTITVGVDDTGYDVKFFGATTGKSLLWDESADTLIVTGDSTVSGTLGVTGVLTATSLDISGDIDVDGTTNLDVVDIDGAVDMASTLAVGGRITSANSTVGSGTASTYVDLTVNGASTANYGPMIELQSAGTAFGKISSYGRIVGGTSTDMFVTTASTNSLVLGTNNTQRFRIASDGNLSLYEDTGTTPKLFWDASAESLGIGTSSPEKPLHVNSGTGNIGVRVESSDATASIEFMDSGTTSTATSARVGGISNDFFVQTNGLERLRINSSGNVGIGASSLKLGTADQRDLR